jgi:hypothetical protein
MIVQIHRALSAAWCLALAAAAAMAQTASLSDADKKFVMMAAKKRLPARSAGVAQRRPRC